MPRIRSIKPDFWNDAKLGQEPEPIMLTFIGLWNFSDDYGVVKANPVWLKNQVYPYKDKLRIDAFSVWLDRLSELEAIVLFTYKGENFYCIRTFRKHQKVEKPSKARNCPEEYLLEAMFEKGFVLNESEGFIKSGNSRGVFGEQSALEIGKEIGKGKEADSPTGDGGAKAPPILTEIYSKLKKEKRTVWEFIRDNKPDFIQPYVDLWNYFADEHGLAKVQKVNDARKRYFRIRIKDAAFDFAGVLKKAAASDFLRKGKWFGFDWIIENEKNFLKVLEGNYDNKSPDQEPSKEVSAINQKLKSAGRRQPDGIIESQ